MNVNNNDNWDLVITPSRGWFELNLKELWNYRYLLWIFINRNIVTEYKQTILGPLWLFIQPALTTVVFTIIFGNIAKIPTDGIPKPLFYLAGLIVWNYFSMCLMGTSNTLLGNANLYGKVYFPRLIIPIATIISSLFRFFIQLLLFICMVIYYIYIIDGFTISINYYNFLFFPILIFIMGCLGLGIGLIISALTVKYRDLKYLMSFGTRLFMYASPIIFPLSLVPMKYQYIILLNPMSAVIEIFRFISLGKGFFIFSNLIYSLFSTSIILFIGILIFNKVEKTFIDSI